MSNSEFESGDPWDLISQAPEPETADAADSEEDAAPADAPESPLPAPVPDTPDAPPLETGDAAGSIEMPDLDAGIPEVIDDTPGELESPQFESTDLGLPELEMPDLDMAGIESAPIDVADIDSGLDIDSSAADALEMPKGVDFGDVAEAEDAAPASRGPLSAMLAGTGLFGDTDELPGEMPSEGIEADTADMEDIAELEDAAATVDMEDFAEHEDAAATVDMEDIVEHEDAAATVDMEDIAEPVDVPDLEPVDDSPQWAGVDSELPDAQPDWLGGQNEVDAETSEPPSVYKELEGLAPEAEAGAEEESQPGIESPVDDFAALYGTDEDADSGQNGFGVTFGDEAHADSEETTDIGSDDDIARVAAMVADMEPIVAGDAATDAPETALSDLDWLDAGEEVEAVDGEVEPDLATETVDETSSMSDFSVPEVNFGEQVESDIDRDLPTPEIDGDHAIGFAEEPGTTGEPEPSDLDLLESLDEDQAEPFDQTDAGDDDKLSTDSVSVDETDSEPTAEMIQADPFDAAPSEPDDLGELDGEADDALDLLELDEGTDGDLADEDSSAHGFVEAAADDDEPSGLIGAATATTAVVGTGAAVEWGARWEQSQQGWVDGEWRPIVTTSETLAAWSVDVYLGVVVGDTLIPSVTPESLAGARAVAEAAMINEATARGAHAVLGVTATVEQVGDQTLVTSSGTAVTLVTLDDDE